MKQSKVRNFEELLKALPSMGYSAGTEAQLRAAVKRAAKVYNTELRRIPADLDAFEQRFGRGRIRFIEHGFKQKSQFENWRKRVRAALAKATMAAPRGAELGDEWSRLVAFVRENGGVGRRLPPHRDKSVGAVARLASRDGCCPRTVDAAWVDATAKLLKTSQRRSFRLGLRALNDLIAKRAELPEIADLLPPAPIPEPAAAATRSSSWRRGGRAEAATLWHDFDRFVEARRDFDALGRPMPAEHSDFGPVAARNYESVLSSATGMLERAGDLTPGTTPSLADICNPATIARVANLWRHRVIDGEVRDNAVTLHTFIARLCNIAEYVGLDEEGAAELKKLRAWVRKGTPAHDGMSPARQEWLQRFGSNPALKRQLHRMPETLMRDASKLLAEWQALKRGRKSKAMMTALSFGIAACAATILFRVSPLRARNLRELAFRGPDAQLVMRNGGAMRLSIPGGSVKNGKPIDAELDSDAAHFVAWYLAEIRPKLVQDHPYGHELADSDYLFPGKTEFAPMNETVLADHYQRGCDHLGLDMTLHLARHITTYLILDDDPNAVAEAAALLSDEVSTVRAHYAWVDAQKASEAGRERLRASRKKAFKHKPGAKHGV